MVATKKKTRTGAKSGKVRKKKTTRTKAPVSKKDVMLKACDELAKSFDVQIMKGNSKDRTPYYIPFRNVGLQFITGGIPGGRLTVIEGESQSGKSYILYEVIAECLKAGGYALLVDPEIAYEPRYGRRVGIEGEDGFAYTETNKLEKIFRLMKRFVLKIRKVDPDSPIVLGLDSYPATQIKLAFDELNKEVRDTEKELKGYMQARKNAVLSELLSEFIGFIGKHKVAFVMLNQVRFKMNVMYGDATTSNAENILKFYATLRVRGKLGSKIKKQVSEKRKRQIGVYTTWETIKNRHIDPFKKVTTAIYYRSGVRQYSGVCELLFDEGVLTEKPKKKFSYNGKLYDQENIKTFIGKYPEALEHKT